MSSASALVKADGFINARDTTVVYIDGSARPVNGQNRAGYGVFWVDDDFRDLTTQDEVQADASCIANGGSSKATCARAEVMAMKVVLQQIVSEQLAPNLTIIIKCDNIYVVRGVNEWMNKWHRENFRDRAHADLWRDIYGDYSLVRAHVVVEHVYAHRGEFGNEIADQLAKGTMTIEQAMTVKDTTGVGGSSSTHRQPHNTSKQPLAVTTQPTPSSRQLPIRPATTTIRPATTVARPPMVKAPTTADRFGQWLMTNQAVTTTTSEVQHGQQLKAAGQKGGITFYHTGTVLPQGPWWQQMWTAYKQQ